MNRRPPTSTRYFWRLPLLVAATTIAIACGSSGSDSVSGPSASVTGSFQLSNYNGKAIPVTLFQDTAFTDVLTDGGLTLGADGSYLATMSVTETIAGHASVYVDTGTGKWSQAGQNVVFTGSDSVKQMATWNGSTLTLTDTTAHPASTLVFTKK